MITLATSTALVTGATGTVGRAVVARLVREGTVVRALARSPDATLDGAQIVRGELADREALRLALDGVELVVHCAAALTEDLDLCTRTNVDGTRHLLDAMAAAGTTALVHLSTVSVYDHRHGMDMDEDSPLWTEPVTAYGYTKALAERLVADAARGGLRSTVLRPVAVLSMHPTAFWGPLALERARASADPVAPVAEFPYVHVDNLADAIAIAAAAPMRGRSYNVIDGAGPTQLYLDAVAAAIGRPSPALPPDAPRIRYAGVRIRDELGYAPLDRWKEFLVQLARPAT
jgi:nucleoside-diphosphate-sugar epimerase